MKRLGIVGWKGSGKTTLVVRLLSELSGRGFVVSTLKHAHHSFDIDQPGRDSHAHRAAGAAEVMISSQKRWALMHETGGGREATLDELAAKMHPVDLLLVEGYKRERFDKIEVHRPAVGKPLLAPGDRDIVAVAVDRPLDGVDRLQLDLDDVAGIADFIVGHCGLARDTAAPPPSRRPI